MSYWGKLLMAVGLVEKEWYHSPHPCWGGLECGNTVVYPVAFCSENCWENALKGDESEC